MLVYLGNIVQIFGRFLIVLLHLLKSCTVSMLILGSGHAVKECMSYVTDLPTVFTDICVQVLCTMPESDNTQRTAYRSDNQCKGLHYIKQVRPTQQGYYTPQCEHVACLSRACQA